MTGIKHSKEAPSLDHNNTGSHFVQGKISSHGD